MAPLQRLFPPRAVVQLQHEHLSSACVLIYANKQDLVRRGVPDGVAFLGVGLVAGREQVVWLGWSGARSAAEAWLEGRQARLCSLPPMLPHLPCAMFPLEPQKDAMGVPELSEGLDLISLKSHNWWAGRWCNSWCHAGGSSQRLLLSPPHAVAPACGSGIEPQPLPAHPLMPPPLPQARPGQLRAHRGGAAGGPAVGGRRAAAQGGGAARAAAAAASAAAAGSSSRTAVTPAVLADF